MSGRGEAVGDSQVLANTQKQVDGGRVFLTYPLQSGRKVESGWIEETQLKGAAIAGWCQGVRDAISQDIANTAAEARERASSLAQAPAADETSATSTADSSAATDPDDFILGQLKHAERAWQDALAQQEVWDAKVAERGKVLSRWENVARAMGIIIGVDEDVSSNTESKQTDGGEGSTGGPADGT